MTYQRFISLNPCGLSVIRIIYPPVESTNQEWRLIPMRFIPHDGMAKA